MTLIRSYAPIKFFFVVSMAILLCLASGGDSLAAVDEITSLPFVFQGVIPSPSINGPFNPIRWNLDNFDGGEVPFVLNPNSPDGLTVTLPGADQITDAIRAALQTWEDVATSEISFALETPDSPPEIGFFDGINLITFADPGEDFDPATIAATSIYALVNVGPASVGPFETVVDFPGEIVEADLVFNPISPFATDGNPAAFDVQAVATHELGHAFGRDHTGIISAAMFTLTESGSLRGRDLTGDDVAGISAAYPDEPSFSESFGSISGTVTSGGSPVLGAHVVAVNANGVPLASGLSFPDGTYTVVGLPPGQYTVYAEPTDGPALAEDYDLGVLFPFSPAFNTVRRNDLATVEAGAELEGVDFAVTAPAPLNLTGITPLDPNIFLPIAPNGLLVERGGALEAEFVGIGLSDEGISITFDGPGIGPAQVVNFLPGNPFSILPTDSSVDFRITISSDAPLGPRNAVVTVGQNMAILPGAITIVEQGSLPPSTPPASGGGTISDGQTVSANLAAPNQSDLWTFSGSVGDVVTVSMSADLGSSLDSFLGILGPDGVQVAFDDDSGRRFDALINLFTLPATGTYTIVARGFGTSIGAYTLWMKLVQAGEALTGTLEGGGPISPGQTVSGDLSAPGRRDTWTFSGSVGDVVTISMNASLGSTLDAFIELMGPDGAQVALDNNSGPGLDALISLFRLPSTGTYSIITRGFRTSTGAYTLTLQSNPAGAGGSPIISAQTVSGNLIAQGLRDNWTFNGTQGDFVTIAMDAAAGSSLDPLIELLGPDGAQLAIDNDSGDGLNALITLFRLPASGAYTIVAQGSGATAGAYTLTLQVTPASQLLPGLGGSPITPGQTVSGSLAAIDQIDIRTFDGTVGDLVTIAVNAATGSSLDPLVELLGPNGVQLAIDNDGGDGLNSLISNFQLPTTGSFSIAVSGSGGTTGAYTLTLQLVPVGTIGAGTTPGTGTGGGTTPGTGTGGGTTPGTGAGGGTITPGQTISVDLTAAAGQSESLTFEGTAGDFVTITLNAPPGSSLILSLELLGPDGSQIATGSNSADGLSSLISNFRLPATGTFTVVARASGASTGDFTIALELISGAGGGLIRPGQTVPGSLSEPGLRDAWIFDGTAGDLVTIALNAATGSSLDPLVELMSPDGVLVSRNNDSGPGLNALITNFRLPSTGAYTIIARGSGISTGAYTLTLQSTPPEGGPGGGPISPGQTVSANITAQGQSDEWTFDGTVGDLVTIAMDAASGSSLDAFLELLGPDGVQVVFNDDGGEGVNSLISAFRLPSTGAYTIIARGFSTSTGAYTLTLQLTPASEAPPVPGGGPINAGQTVSGELAAPGQRDSWTFRGSEGDLVTIALNAASGSTLDPLVELLGLDGVRISINDDSGPGLNALITNFQLPASGNYTIVARGFENSIGAYNLTLTLQRAVPDVPPSVDPNPRLALRINSTSFRVGDVVNLNLDMFAGSEDLPVDLYVAIRFPNGSFVFMTQDPRSPFDNVLKAFQREFVVRDTSLGILNAILPEGSQGDYTVIAAFLTGGSAIDVSNIVSMDSVDIVIE